MTETTPNPSSIRADALEAVRQKIVIQRDQGLGYDRIIIVLSPTDWSVVLSAMRQPPLLATDDQIKRMVDRFLSWRLPDNFQPDAGISFKAEFNEHTAHPMKHQPMGTNLLNAVQAEAMVRYMVDAPALIPASIEPIEGGLLPEDIAELVQRIGEAEWGATAALDADSHAEHVANSVRETAKNFEQTGPQQMHGLYIKGTETVICHTGTSPNSPQIARALTGAWNKLLADARTVQSQPSEAAHRTVKADWKDGLAGAYNALIQGRADLVREKDRNTHLKGVYEPCLVPFDVAIAEVGELYRARAATPSTPVSGGEVVQERYGAQYFEWAAPGDRQHDVWMVRFDDNEVRDLIFTGDMYDDPETEAWAAWDRHAPGYNCRVFRLAKLRLAYTAEIETAVRQERERIVALIRKEAADCLEEGKPTCAEDAHHHEALLSIAGDIERQALSALSGERVKP